MDWKNEAIEKLCKLEAMEAAVENLQEELLRLELAYTGLQSADPERVGISGISRGEDRLLSNIVQRKEVENRLAQAKVWVEQVSRALGVLSHEERLILQRCFIQAEKCAVDNLCYDLGAEKSTIYRKRDKALLTFTTALYGVA